jgi:hypothetical protein
LQEQWKSRTVVVLTENKTDLHNSVVAAVACNSLAQTPSLFSWGFPVFGDSSCYCPSSSRHKTSPSLINLLSIQLTDSTTALEACISHLSHLLKKKDKEMLCWVYLCATFLSQRKPPG